MTETLRNSLSAMLDQEASEFETRRIIDSVKTQPELKNYWASCQLIKSALQGEPLVPSDLLARVNRELDGEASLDATPAELESKPQVTFLPAREPLPSRFGAVAGQLALAASVAFAVVVGVKVVAPLEMATPIADVSPESLEVIQFQLPVQKETVSVQGIQSPESVVDNAAPQTTARILTEQDMKQMVSQRLGSYLLRHAENTAVVGSSSVLPLARVMGRDEPIE